MRKAQARGGLSVAEAIGDNLARVPVDDADGVVATGASDSADGRVESNLESAWCSFGGGNW